MDKEPECYGREWSQSASECSGGYDAGFISPTGGHVRPRCDFFEACKVRTTLTKANERTTAPAQLMPASALIRPPYSPPATPTGPFYGQYVPGRPAAPTQYHPQHYPQISYDPVRMVPMAHEMPAYLAVREERQPGESYWAPLLRAMLRSIGKALGHTVSNFFDREPLRRGS